MEHPYGKVRCLGCGKIDEQEMAYLESLVPPPRILAEGYLVPASNDEPTPKTSLTDVAGETVTFTLGECSDCGMNSWTHIDGRTVTLSEPPAGKHTKKTNG